MLSLLKIKNIALIDELTIEFGDGLNLLTGETGSGKSIIVDSLGAVTGERVSADLIKDGESSATIEAIFSIGQVDAIGALLDESGIDMDASDEIIVKRELSVAGKNRIFLNGQAVTQGFLKRVGAHLVGIHGQGEQAGLYDVDSHIKMLDEFAGADDLMQEVADAFEKWSDARSRLASLTKDTAEKLQMLDVLRFQVSEIRSANLEPDEEETLEHEKRRLSNVERLTALSTEAFSLLYDAEESTSSTLEKAQRKVSELADIEPRFAEYADGVAAARAVIDDLALAIRDFSGRLEFSPGRLDEIESRLAEILRLKRKYGGTVELVLDHLRISEERLQNIESSEQTEEELTKQLKQLREEFLQTSRRLHNERAAAASDFEKQVEESLAAVALEKARFEVRIEANEADESRFGPTGYDSVEFYFSANPGEPVKPLARVASGGEASRVMLILKTTIKQRGPQGTAVFDEIDVGIGGRVAEAVGRKLKSLASTQQVLCVTHQPQIASLADRHFIVEKSLSGGRTVVSVRELSPAEQVEEIARMLAGESITEQARENARSMLAGR